jgi:porphobilinogen synthase
MHFPEYRARRLRRNKNFRDMIRETKLDVKDFICPMFVTYGNNIKREIKSMPGQFHLSVDNLLSEAKEIYSLGIPAVLLFGIPENKDDYGSSAYDYNGIIQEGIKRIKNGIPELIVITDVCLCEYTSHGHCGIIKDGDVDNDATLELLAKMALSHVKAGADMVAPSDMMDGRVAAIREALDSEGFQNIPIMSYSAKYASSFYGPFRDAAYSTPKFGDRKSYQMDPGNSDEALREIEMDIDEGADIVMVKPALSYLDVIYRVKQIFGYPLAAYNVSGEYAMIKGASKLGLIDGEKVMMEALISIKRAGADMIITYFAKEAATLLEG